MTRSEKGVSHHDGAPRLLALSLSESFQSRHFHWVFMLVPGLLGQRLHVRGLSISQHCQGLGLPTHPGLFYF